MTILSDLMMHSLGPAAVRAIYEGTAFVSKSRDRIMMRNTGGSWEVYADFRYQSFFERNTEENRYIDWLAQRDIRFDYDRPGWYARLPSDDVAIEWRIRWM